MVLLHKSLNFVHNIGSTKKEESIMKWFDNTALTIVIIGAVNWLLVGIFRFDLVAFLFGNLSWLSRIIYTIVGICGLYLISLYGRMKDMTDVCS
mgnify:FL=1